MSGRTATTYGSAIFGEEVLPSDWRGLVLDDPEDRKRFNRRQLEVVAMLELAAAIKAGEMFVTCG
jgi:hypothetical protein